MRPVGMVVRNIRPLEWVSIFTVITAVVGAIFILSLTNRTNNLIKANQSAAKAGLQAHNRQCRLLPASLKLYSDAHARGVISKAELGLITGSAAALQCTPAQNRAATTATP